MLSSYPEFVENRDYAYAVARIRALETKMIDAGAVHALLSAPEDRFLAHFTEVTGIGGGDDSDFSHFLSNLEESFSKTFSMIKSLIIEDEMKRLISLKYDYELLKLIVKGERGRVANTPLPFVERSNYGYGGLKTALSEGKALETGEILMRTYRAIMGVKDAGGREIDSACDKAYYTELFKLLDACNNEFIRNYFIRKIDAQNLATTLRLKAKGKKRSLLAERYIPFGSIDLSYIEEGFDLNLEGFAARIIFSPFSSLLTEVDKNESEEDQIAALERLLDNNIIRYLKESGFVTFGIEPLLTYLWMKEIELKNLRTVLIARNTGIPADEIKRHVRGFYGG